MTLFDLGWNDTFTLHFAPFAAQGQLPARVVRAERERYLVRHAGGTFTGSLLGRLRYDDDALLPAVGDWVAVEDFDDGQVVIHAVLPRSGAFIRKQAGAVTRPQVLAANVDVAFLVSGLDGDFNPRRIERYLVQTAASGARPVVVLNKADLCADPAARRREVARRAPGTPVLFLSALQADGPAALRAAIEPGRTYVFLGSSGVGKSTLVNALLGVAAMETTAVRADDSRGRHTTTHRQLFVLPGGGVVIDTPGLRELQLWGEEADLRAAFDDVAALAAGCRFRDCAHEGEPGCAVEAALATGALDADRVASYHKLRRELRALERRQGEAARYQERRRDKRFGRLRSRINRDNPKR